MVTCLLPKAAKCSPKLAVLKSSFALIEHRSGIIFKTGHRYLLFPLRRGLDKKREFL